MRSLMMFLRVIAPIFLVTISSVCFAGSRSTENANLEIAGGISAYIGEYYSTEDDGNDWMMKYQHSPSFSEYLYSSGENFRTMDSEEIYDGPSWHYLPVPNIGLQTDNPLLKKSSPTMISPVNPTSPTTQITETDLSEPSTLIGQKDFPNIQDLPKAILGKNSSVTMISPVDRSTDSPMDFPTGPPKNTFTDLPMNSPTDSPFPRMQDGPTRQDNVGIEDLPKERTKTRSEIKCDEYNKEPYDVAQLMAYLESMNQTYRWDLEPGCFIQRQLVIGGSPVLPYTYRHIVALGKMTEENKFVFKCGGSLIAPNWVLTAAHCTHGHQGGVTIARVGINFLNDTTGETLNVKRTIRHPSYKPPAFYGDIALLELEKPATLTVYVRPACLHQKQDELQLTASVCGWGVTDFEATDNSNSLQEAVLNFIDNEKCAMVHNTSSSVPDGIVPSMICAGSPRDDWTKDTCHGDSGGPLQNLHREYDCIYKIIGITSFGLGCAIPNSPGVYTRVSHYVEWIEDIVWPEDN